MDSREILTMAVELEAEEIDHWLDVPTMVGLIRQLAENGLDG